MTSHPSGGYLLVVLGGVLILTGGGLLAACLSTIPGWLDLLGRSVSSIAEAEEASDELGPSDSVGIEGTVRVADEEVAGAFTGSRAVAAEYEIEEYEQRGTTSGTWERVHRADERVPFLLEDDTGRILVEPAGAHLDLKTLDEITVPREARPPDRIDAYLEQTGTEPVYPERRRYSERTLSPGDPAFVLGPVERDPDAAAVEDVTAVVRDAAGTDRFRVSVGSKHSAVGRSFVAVAMGFTFGLGSLVLGCILVYVRIAQWG